MYFTIVDFFWHPRCIYRELEKRDEPDEFSNEFTTINNMLNMCHAMNIESLHGELASHGNYGKLPSWRIALYFGFFNLVKTMCNAFLL